MDLARLERRLTIAAFLVSSTATMLSFYTALYLGLARYVFMGLLWSIPMVATGRSLLKRTS